MPTTEWKKVQSSGKVTQCRKCENLDIEYQIYESSCGGYEDYHFRCTDCGHDWWVDGIDS